MEPQGNQQRASDVAMARLAEQAERYTDMAGFMSSVVLQDQNLTVEERNLLSVAYKNVIGSLRVTWRIVTSIEQKNAQQENMVAMARLRKYRVKIEEQFQAVCEELLKLLELIIRSPQATEPELQVFVHKMKGDHYRYMAEFATGELRAEYRNRSMNAYRDSSDTASSRLPPTHPIRLGLALSVAAFSYEILGAHTRACEVAKAAFDEAIAHLDELSEEEYKDSTLIMQLLQDNLALWTSDQRDQSATKPSKLS